MIDGKNNVWQNFHYAVAQLRNASYATASDVFRVYPVSGRCVRPAGWMARIGWSGPARPAWLNAAAARFRCRPRRGRIVAAARPPTACSYIVYVSVSIGDLHLMKISDRDRNVNKRRI